MKINCEAYPYLNIEVDAGSINSNLKGVIGLPDDTDSIENLKDEQYVQGAGDAIESFLLALAGEGVDLTHPVYGKALATFLDAIGNNRDDRPLSAQDDFAGRGHEGAGA